MTETRRRILQLAGGSLAASGLAAPAIAQGAARPFRIYMITFRGVTEVEKGFQDYLAANKVPCEFIMRDVDRNVGANLPKFLEEIRATRPDLVYTWGTPITLGVLGTYDQVDPARHITDIPVLFTIVAAPVMAKVVPKFESSGRNVTGVYHIAPQETQLKAMKSYREFKRMGVMYSLSEQNSVVQVDELRRLSKDLGFELLERPFKRGANGLPIADGAADTVQELKRAGADWLFYLPDTFLGTIFNITSPAAEEVKLPTFASAETGIRSGGALAGLICRFYNIGQFTGYKAQQILQARTPPDRIPIETLTRFSLIIRMNVAKRIGVYPPIGMLNFAEVLTS